MGSFSETVRNAWLNALRGVSYSNADIWVQLHIGAPGAAGTANPAANTERVQATLDAPTTGSTSNSADITWIDVSDTETYSHVSLWSAPTGGSLIGTDDLAVPEAVIAGQDFTIVAGALTLAVA